MVRVSKLFFLVAITGIFLFCLRHNSILFGSSFEDYCKTEGVQSRNMDTSFTQSGNRRNDSEKIQRVTPQLTGRHGFTIVTGLIDIGRGHWKTSQNRGYDEYLAAMKKVLSLEVNMVVFIEEKGRKVVEEARRGREDKTKIKTVAIKDLEYYKYLENIAEIMNRSEYKRDNVLFRNNNCEAIFPKYNLVTNSKFSMLSKVLKWNPFNNDYFCWMDAGYGKGHGDIFPPDGIWEPKSLYEFKDKITFVNLQDPNNYRHKKDLYKYDMTVLAGGVFCGGREVFLRFTQLHRDLMVEWLDTGIADDDQTAALMLYFRHKSMFRLVPGNFFDFLKYFNGHQSSKNHTEDKSRKRR